MATQVYDHDIDLEGRGKLVRPLINPIASDPGSPAEGEMWTNTTDGKLKYRAGGVTYLLATMADVTAGGVSSSLWDANSIVKADTDNTPVALTIGASTVLGRRASGSIVAISYANLKTDLAITATDVGLANVPNVDARARASHTGTQLASTISDFNTAADARITNWVGAAPGALDTLVEIAEALNNDAGSVDAVIASLATKAKGFAANFGNGALQSFNIDHNLGTTDVIVQCFVNATGATVSCPVSRTTANRVVVTTNSVPATDAYRCVVIAKF